MTIDSLLLIVFTDEVKSTEQDARCTYARQILSARANLFGPQIECLNKFGWLIIKNVGDQLVMRFDNKKNYDIEDIVTDCLIELYNFWKKELKGKIRIAVHTPREGRGLATGKDINEYLLPILKRSAQKTKKCLKNLWPSIKFLEEDMFGFDMNLAARLVTIPKTALFIITEGVYNLCNQGGKLKNQVAISDPIPIINLKGFETVYGVDKPLIIREIREK